MESFNYLAARQAGYSEEEIGRFLANQYSFDYDGAVAEGYKPQEIVDFLSIRETKPVAAPEVEERTVGNAVQDLAASFGVGTGQLVGLLGSAYGLTTGDMDNRATRFGANTAEFWEARKTPILKAAEDLRQARVDAAEGEFEKAGVAIWETIKNPMLLVSEVTKQVPNLAVGGLAGLGAKTVGKVGAATLGKELSEQAVTKIGVGAATGSELGLSSADFGQSAYDQLMAIPDEVWAANPDLQERTGGNPDLFFRVKREMATELAQNSAIAGGIVTFGLNKLPGAKTIEKVLGGDALTGTRTRRALTGLAGETVSEGAEEAATQLSANIAQAQIDPNTDLTAGLGQAGGLGALVGGAFGAGAGALSPQRTEAPAPSGLESLSVGQTDTINGNIVSRTQSGFDITTPTGMRIQTDLSGANTILNRPVEEQRPPGLLRDATNAGEAVSAAEDIIGSIDADIEALEREVDLASTDAIVESITPAPITPAPITPAPITPAPITPAPQETLQSGRGLLAQEMTGTASVTLPPVEPAPTLTLEALASADISSMPAPERQEFLADLNFARTAELPAQRQSALTRAAETYGRTVGPIQQPVARATPEEALQATRQPTVERLTTAAPDIDALLGADTRGLDQEDRADFNAQLAMARTAEPGPVQTAALNRAAEIYGRAIGPIQPRTQALAAERVTTAAPDLNALLTADTRALPQEDRDDFNAQLAMARTTEPGPAQTAALNRAAEIYGRTIGPIQPRTQGSARPEAPRPTRLLGRATETYTAPELQSLADNTKLPEITRRGAQIELRARSDFATSFNPTMAPMRTQPLEVSTNVEITRTAPAALQQGGAASLPDAAVNVPTRADERRAAFQPILDSVLRPGDPKITLGAPTPEVEAQIQEMSSILGSAFGQDLPVVAFSDPSPESPNGFALKGQAFVNVSGLQTSAPRTTLHEFKHVVEQIALAERAAGLTDTAAQEFTEQIESIFDDMSEEGKRSYAEKLLFTAELEGLSGAERETRLQELLADPLLRSEMTADFLGNRAQDKKFWTDLAAADPQGFTGFVERWLAVVNNLLAQLRGAKNQGTKESARVDKYIKDLNRAKLTAQSALINYRKATGQAPVATPAAAAAPQFSIKEGASLADTASLAGANRVSSSQTWRKGRDLKVALQQRVIDAAAARGIDVSTDSPETREYLREVGMKDALAALNQNPNAIGWYDIKTRQALAVMSLVHPEIARDENARFAFTWALAVTSNGMKVEQNFELAEKVYDRYKREGVMPSNVGTGTAGKAINQSLAMFNELRDAWGIDNLRQFMQTNFTVSEITGLSKDLTPGGEFANTTVKGAAILGPKIGNGFFSNLYGDFTSLTMDRWLIRTWGRWTGTLIKAMPEQTALARTRLSNNVKAIVANKQEAARLEALIGAEITADMDVDQLSAVVQKASMDPKIRAKLNETDLGQTLRLAGNSLAKYLDGQKEAPSGPEERQYIRAVFNDILDELNQTDQYKDLMMADLQAVLWYAEKRLYETAKDDPNQLAADEGVEGYDDESAPDYANAAARIARQKGVTDKRINATLKRIENERSTAARSEDGVSQDAGDRQPAAGRGFTRQEKRKFIGERAILRVRANRTGDAQSPGSYSSKGQPDGGRVRVLKSLGVSYTNEWKLNRDAATAFRANKMPAPEFLELASTAENAQKFAESISENKVTHPFGAAVYVYPSEEYRDMRLFLTEDGKSGVAIKPDGDIVSVFSTGGAGRAVMELAVAAGGRKLDAFDTILPEFYAPHGFRAVARTRWNDEFAPEAWNKDTFEKFNNGEPDVVFMVYDPAKMDAEYNTKDGKVMAEYDRAVNLQNREMKRLTPQFSRKQGDVLARDPRLEQAAQGMKEGTVTSAEYRELVNAIKPVTPYTEAPDPAKPEDIRRALTSDKLDRIGVPSKTLKAGDPVGLRLDIPAYANHGVWVVSVHDQIPGFAAGKSIGYESVAAVTNPTFGVVESAALNIASGKPKATIAVMKGDWKPISPKQAAAAAKLAMKSDSWVQVGMDPTRHAYFYDRASMEPVVSADEAIQVGPLVLAKNPVYGNKEDFRFSRKQADDTDEPVRIRLGRTDNTAANKALDSLQAKLAANPLNETELMRKGAAVKLSVFNGKLHINLIRSTSPGQGEASELLDVVIAEADAAGAKLTLFADSYVEDGALNTDALVDWYSRRGFEEVRRDEDGVEMRRYPANLQFSRKQGGDEVADIRDAREERNLRMFSQDLRSRISDSAKTRAENTRKVDAEGGFLGLEVGDTFLTQGAGGRRWRNKVIAKSLSRVGPSMRRPTGNLNPISSEFEYTFDNTVYTPALYVETIGPDGDVSQTTNLLYLLDQTGYTKMGGPKFSRKQTDTPAFKRWFGDSKVVDKNGEPRVVYHGSTVKGVTEFDTSRVTTRSERGDVPGTYFTSTLDAAYQYTRLPGAKAGTPRGDVTAAYLRLENPLNTTAAIKRYRKRGMSFGDAKRKALEALTPEHDGIIFDGTAYNAPEYVVFSPTQIKSAIGNTGAFDPGTPDIRFSKRQVETPEFKNWFGDSKVVGADGQPLVVYHGTAADFDVFKRTRIGEFGSAIYTTDSADEAFQYAVGSGSRSIEQAPLNTMPVYVSLQNPYTEGVDAYWKRFGRDKDGNSVSDAIAQENAIAAGFDGVIAKRLDSGNKVFTHYIAFNPAQIKSAIGNVGTFDPTNPDIRFSVRQPPFYSSLKRTVADLPERMRTQPAKQWVQWLTSPSNQSRFGFKKEEVTWSGVEEYLNMRGKDKVTADDIIQYLNENNVTVEDVVLDGAVVEESVYPEGSFLLPESGEVNSLEYWREELQRVADTELDDISVDELMEELEDVSGEPMPVDAPESSVQYAQYVAGQGDNYREVLITLPVKQVTKSWAAEDIKNAWRVKDQDGLYLVTINKNDAKTAEEAIAKAALTFRGNKLANAVDYKSSHWSAPNVLAHLRVDDRTTATGENVLFVNEVQSDWGQGARKGGVRSETFIEGDRLMSSAFNELTDVFHSDRFARARGYLNNTQENSVYFLISSPIDEIKTFFKKYELENAAEIIALVENYKNASALRESQKMSSKGVSPAPFIADTESWATLAIKRAVVMAVDGEYDKVAFVNGEQAAEMFDLSKRVGEILYNEGDGLYSLVIYSPDDDLIHKQDNASPDEVANLVGKDLANKIVNGEGVYNDSYGATVISGLDLKVGGEGMVGFYDGIVPNILRKLAKKFGGTVAVEPVQVSPGRRKTNDQLTLTITDDLRKQVQDIGLPLFSRKQNIFGQTMPPSNWTAEEGKMDDAIYSLQDKLVDTKRVLQGIRKAGNTVADKWDGYLQETLYHGRTATRTTDFIDDELAPLIKGMDAGSVSMKEFDTYLHNRHAQERNAAIARINPALPDAGSGIKSADARAYLAAMDPNRRATLEALAQKVDAITGKTRQALLAGGLESQAAIDAWESTYSQYVPLMREELDFDPSGGKGGSGAGFSVKGNSSRRATGSSTRAVVDILANIAMQRERAIVRAEKNRVSQAMYGLAIQNPNPGFWLPINPDAIKDKAALAAELVAMGINPLQAQNIAEQPTQSYVDPRSGLVTKRVNSFLADNPNVLVARVNGKDRFLLFNSQDERANRMVTALKNMDADQLGRAMSMFAVGTRWFASVNTQYNPIFGLINFARDVQGGLLNLSTTAIAGKQKDVTKNTIPALIGIYRDLRSGTPSQWATLWEDFQQAGGQTGFRDQFSQSEERGKALQKELDALRNGTAKKAGKAVLNWLSDYNTAMENAVRLSAYKVALDNGLSKDRAASLAKNLTVNFNKKGQVATQMGALYAFFNASVQGSARLLETLKGPAGKKIVYGGLLLGSAQALAMAAAGFDEDEPPQFLRERNIIIPIGDKKYLAVPMPLGFNVIPNTGRVLTEWAMSGFENTGARAFDLAGSFVDMFNPIGNAGFSGQTIAPTIADPAVALFENRDWSGNPISKENFNSLAPTPGYTRAKDTASFLSKELSYYLNLASGGTEFAPGALSPTPDQLDYVWGQLTGGLGREIMKTEQTVTALATGEDLPPFKIPLFGRLYGDTGTSAADSNRFYENIRRMNIHKEEIQGRQESRRPVGEYYRDNPDARLVTMAGSVYRDVQQMRNRKREMVERGASRESVRIMEQRIASRMRQFNDQLARM